MLSILLFLLLTANEVSQTDKAQVEVFKREAAVLQAGVEEAVNSIVPGPDGVLERPRAAYLEGYGVVVSLQATFGPTRNPFSSPKTPADVRKLIGERKKSVQDRLEKLLKEHVGAMQSVGEAESLAIALHLLNANPADMPSLPSQILFTIKKAEPAQVVVREF